MGLPASSNCQRMLAMIFVAECLHDIIDLLQHGHDDDDDDDDDDVDNDDVDDDDDDDDDDDGDGDDEVVMVQT